jgi:hypothetical protein
MKFTQNGWIVLGIALLLLLAIKFLIPGTAQIVSTVVVIALAGLVYKMTVLVDQFRFKVSMGVGVFNDEVALFDVVACRVYDGTVGFGYRRTKSHIIYNINSKRAVEIVVKDRQQTILVGCDNPEEIAEQLQQYLKEGKRH